MAKRSGAAEAKADEGQETAALSLLSGSDALADVLGEVELDTDGLEELESSDIRLAALVFNFKGIDKKTEEPIPPNVYFNTVTEETKKKVRLAVLTYHKSHQWSEFDDVAQKTKNRCRSWDRVRGEMDDGTVRACNGCPDRAWKMDEKKGKRSRNCSDVVNAVALDLESKMPVVIRFKRTAERPWTDYLNKHIIGKRGFVNGKPAHMPLFAAATTLSLEMVSGKGSSYARPVLERDDQLFSADEIRFFAESAKAYREIYLDDVRRVAEDVSHESDADGVAGTAGDTSFDPSSFSDDDLPNAAPAAEAEAPNRF